MTKILSFFFTFLDLIIFCKSLIGYCLGQISRNVEYQILYETIFYNYTKIKQCERDFGKMVAFLVILVIFEKYHLFFFNLKNFLTKSENVETSIRRNQMFELTKFTMVQ